MRRAVDLTKAHTVINTASEVCCPHCESTLWICEHRERLVYRLDGPVHQVDRIKRCSNEQCEGRAVRYRPLVDLRLALPRMSFGLDVVVAVGEGHLSQGRSLTELGRELTDKGVPVHQTHVGRLLRNFLALCQMARGGASALQRRLLERGGMVLMVDGVQFDDRSPVLYLCWDALSGSPLFGVRMESRDTEALSGLLQRVKAMGVPVLGIVTDAEKGLVPAVRQVFPQVPYQLCHTHFLKNCAKPLADDLRRLGEDVAERAERVRKLGKRVAQSLESQPPVGVPVKPAAWAQTLPVADPAEAESLPVADPAEAESPASSVAEPISEREVVKQLCALGKLDARASGKAPLNPPELVRHRRLEQLRQVVDQAAKKKWSGHPVAPGTSAGA